MDGNDSHVINSSLANDNDETLRWMGSDGDTNSQYPSSCRHADNDGFNGGNCFVTRGFVGWSTIGLWGESSNIPISRCFGCAGRLSSSLPTPGVVNGVLQLQNWDHGVNSTYASFSRAMAGYRFDDELPWD